MSDVAGAESELALDDAYLDDNAGNGAAVIDLQLRTPAEAFLPACLQTAASGPSGTFWVRGISVDRSSTDGDATYAYVTRNLLNTDRPRDRITRRYQCGITHPHKIRYIHPAGTTARGISVYQ
jgi:hypothetical protein